MGQPDRLPCEVRYIANAGLLFTSGTTRLLVDALVRDGIPPYATPDDAERRRLEAAQPPFADVSAVLVTHWHEDHFSAEAAAAHLGRNPRAVLVSSHEVTERVARIAAAPGDRLRPVTPPPGQAEAIDVAGLRVHVLRLRHNPARRMPDQHVGFLVEGCRTLLHVGDADPETSNFTLLQTLPRVDVAALPFWYMSGARARGFVSGSIRPSRVLAVHVPPQDADAVAGQLTGASPPTVLLRGPGQTVLLDVRP
jgi:L-ascorbate metabolism protein UlaG (beta-lactamase superfamily)